MNSTSAAGGIISFSLVELRSLLPHPFPFPSLLSRAGSTQIQVPVLSPFSLSSLAGERPPYRSLSTEGRDCRYVPWGRESGRSFVRSWLCRAAWRGSSARRCLFSRSDSIVQMNLRARPACSLTRGPVSLWPARSTVARAFEGRLGFLLGGGVILGFCWGISLSSVGCAIFSFCYLELNTGTLYYCVILN